MIKKFLFSVVVITISIFSLTAQEVWSLEKCIEHARQNSLTMRQAAVNTQNTALNEKQSRMERLPSLNADFSGGYLFGRTIDPITNTYESQSRGTNSYSISAGMIVYNGGRINNSIEQSKLDVAAQNAETEDIANEISLNVAAAYLNILFAEEQLINATKRLEQTQEQLNQTDRLIQAGSLPENERLQIVAQITQDEQQVIAQENNVEIGYLRLKNLMLIDPDFDLQIQNPGDIPVPEDASPDLYNFNAVFDQAMQTQPIIRAGELRIKSAGLEVDIARSGMLPSISLFGNLRTDIATGVPDFTNVTDPGEIELSQSQPVNINGMDASLGFYQISGREFATRSYFEQMNDNFGQSVGVSVSIPIYNKHRNQINMERARLGIINSQITHELNKQQLRADVQLALADAKAAKKQLEAAQKTVDALQASYDNTERKFNLGAANTFEYTSAKTQLDLAKVDSIIAKYDYLYKLKIVDFYQGKKITL